MARGFLLSGILSMASVAECARSNFARVEVRAEAEDEQTLDASTGVLLAAGGRRHGSGGGVYYEPPDQGCAALKNTTYPIICSGMSGNGWACEPRTLTADGDQEQQDSPNVDNAFCPTYVFCSCRNVTHSGEYTTDMCRDFWLGYTNLARFANRLTDGHERVRATSVDHAAFLQPLEKELCPAFEDACEEDCDSSWDPEKCKEQCTLKSCLDDFPRYTPEFMVPYSTKKDVGCWGRLRGNGMLGKTVLRTIAEYESLAKCCYHQNAEDGPKEFKWMSGSELVHSWRPDKWLRGRKACDAKNGWHSANHLGLDGSTQSKCESLQ